MISTPLMFAIVVGLLVTGSVVALLLAFAKGDSSRAADRLDVLVGRGGRKDSSADMLLKQAMQEVDKKTILDQLTPEWLNLKKVIEQADANITPSNLVGVALMAGCVGAAMSGWLMNVYVIPVGGGLCFLAPFIWVFWKRKKRLVRFGNQLPDAMELTARALRAGHSLAAGMHVVSEELPPPVSKEFARVYEEQNLGIPLEDTLYGMCDRVPNMDLKFFVTSVAIQRQTGGDLAEILDRIGHVIRERIKIQGQVRALSAEGRLSGIVLIALPIGLFLLLLWMKPDYVKLLWTDPTGVRMSVFAIILMIIGAFAIRKIVDIKV